MSTTMGVSAALRLRLKKFVAGIRFLLPLSLILFYSLSAITCPLLRAQTETATLSGIIQDPKGGVVPGVEVTLTRIETGTVGTTTTNGAGIYVFTGLEPGHFRLLVRKEGFKEISIKEFELHVQDKLEQNFSLEIGSVSERVTVEGNGLVINTTDATVGTVIDREFVENLPLNGRSFQTLILLTPGTVLTSASNDGGTFSVNGQRANANSFTVDGVSMNLGSFLNQSNPGQVGGATPGLSIAGTTQGMVAVDALQEFRIQTSTYAPEFGRQPGGQISLLTRSGTNTFHGTAFDYLRNTVFDANNWFNNAASPQIPRGAERQNDFGGTFGGPIFKDRTFFFFSYEGLRLLQPFTGADIVPSTRLRQEAAPSYQPILNSWPIPNGPEFLDSSGNPTGGAPFTDSQSLPTNLDSYSIKVDHTFGRMVHSFAKYTRTASNSINWDASNQVNLNELTSQTFTLGADINLRTNLQNEVRLNYSENVSDITYKQNIVGGAKAFDTSILFPAPLSSQRDNAIFILSLPDAFFTSQQGPYGPHALRQINVVDNVSHSFASHQLRFGIDYRRLFPSYSQSPLIGGYIVASESDLASGTVSQALTQAAQVVHPIYTNFSVYGQDTWRVSKRLSITYGLRWELNPAPGERDGIQPLNVIGLDNPTTATLAPLNSKLYQTTYNNFAPRLGVAYQIRQSPGRETVVRGGFGVFYDLNSETAAIGFGQAPFQNQSAILTNLPFPIANNVLPIAAVPAPLAPPYSNIYAIDPNLKLPYTLQWNLSIEQGLGQNQSLTASYVAAAGDRLLRSVALFNFNSNFQNVFLLRNASSSNYQAMQIQFNRHLSRNLQALASYTYSHSIDDASDGQDVFTSNTGNSVPNPSIDRGNSSFDLRHAFRGATTYELPAWNANFLSKAIVGGWSVDMIGIAQTGLPVDLVGNNYSPSTEPNAFFPLRPNVVPGQPLYLYGTQCGAAHAGVPCPGGRGFNPMAFSPVPSDANGNPTQVEGTLGRNVLRGFGAWQMDFALHRQFNFGERFKLQFRSEFFNIFNHPNFGSINPKLGQGTFGLANGTLNASLGANRSLNQLYQIGGPRSIQLALKLLF